MSNGTHVSVYLAGLAGLASFLSPCVLPLVPPYLAYLGGQTRSTPMAVGGTAGQTVVLAPPRARLVASGASFVAGVSVVFILFFYALRSVLQPIHSSTWLPYVAGTVVIVLALQVAEFIRIPFLMRTFKVSDKAPGRGGLAGGFLLGLCFAAGWTPCIGATLGAVLSSAITEGTTSQGMMLVVIYCVGLGLPFMLLAASVASARPLVQALNRHRRAIDLGSAAVLLVMGLMLLTGNLTQISTWLSGVMPDWLVSTVTL
jgi:cytochrome c-type biogenesis protein